MRIGSCGKHGAGRSYTRMRASSRGGDSPSGNGVVEMDVPRDGSNDAGMGSGGDLYRFVPVHIFNQGITIAISKSRSPTYKAIACPFLRLWIHAHLVYHPHPAHRQSELTCCLPRFRWLGHDSPHPHDEAPGVFW